MILRWKILCFLFLGYFLWTSFYQYRWMSYPGKSSRHDRTLPLVFIGGVPRSGTTLLRVILDAHPEVRCGEETRVIPRLLGLRQQWINSHIESNRLKAAGVSMEVLDNAIAVFILEIIVGHGSQAPRLCNKDPFVLRSSVYLKKLFPNSKFLLMIRDGRAVVHSIISRKITITGYDLRSYRQCLAKWSTAMASMWRQCARLGRSVCCPVYYEELVLNPRQQINRILQFLGLPWNERVLHHDELIGKPGGISVSSLERSTDQVIKPIHIEALTSWVGHIPEDVMRDMAMIAPMLKVLGYDPENGHPDYGKPDSFVLQNTQSIRRHQEHWAAKAQLLQNQAAKNMSRHSDTYD